MAYQKGRMFLLKLSADGSGGTIAGFRQTSVKIGNEAVDVTNKSSNGWRELLEGAGTQTLDLSIDGVCSDDTKYETLKGYAQANTINAYQIVGPDNDSISGFFQITDFTEQGSHNDALTFSASLQSSGAPTFTNV